MDQPTAMSTQVLVAVIAAAASIVGAALTYLFAKMKEKEEEWRKIKFERYQEFMAALSSIVGTDETSAGLRRFAQACNTIQLVASREAIQSLHDFREVLDGLAADNSDERQRVLRSKLIRDLRADLGASEADNPIDLKVRLYGSGTKKQNSPGAKKPRR